VSTTFTPRQGQYLAFIYYYTKVNRQPPSEADIQRFFGVSAPSVHQMIVTLEQARHIERRPGQPRSVRVLVSKPDLPELD
jgi:repressor LexA